MSNSFNDGIDQEQLTLDSATFWVCKTKEAIARFKKDRSEKNKNHLLHCQQKMVHAKRSLERLVD